MKFLYPFIVFLILAGCMAEDQKNNTLEPSVPTDGEATQQNKGQVLVKKLNVPWQINRVQSGEFYLPERSGSIVHIKDGSTERETLQLNREIVAETVGGLLGLLVVENTNPVEAYVYHTYAGNNDLDLLNRVVKVEKEGTVWRETDVIIENIPGGQIHNGGRIKISPDNHLYITTGDSGNESLAQDLNSLAGKILRVNLDGSIPENNPFEDSPIYSYGHRNPQGVTWTAGGQMYSAEHGSSNRDEINKIVPGGNYGWPIIRGDEEKEGMISPLFHSGDQTWAPSGMDAHGSKLYVACLGGQQIRVFDLDSETDQKWASGFGRMRDIKIIDDTLYAITNNRDGRGNPIEEDDRLLKFSLSDSER
ncbi:PQQ-dependent sugar dehydrogenase [Pseudalkalibacillus decolorationis]|uniref:PQQ-dependent sugar dehydrogenase n=1 Tax=Pseudalkalibacillus decolorationis TaxID=163879 RepID=UPI002148C0D0|nr:PQQ-dependent sugar dehydrogenase [Pseudalkalibacillus decolorationis]